MGGISKNGALTPQRNHFCLQYIWHFRSLWIGRGIISQFFQEFTLYRTARSGCYMFTPPNSGDHFASFFIRDLTPESMNLIKFNNLNEWKLIEFSFETLSISSLCAVFSNTNCTIFYWKLTNQSRSLNELGLVHMHDLLYKSSR